MNLSDTLNQLLGKLQGWLDSIILHLPEFVLAVVIVLLTALVARFGRRAVRGVMDSVSSYRQVNQLLATVAYIVILAAGTFIALGILNLDGVVTSLLAGAGIVGLALGFAFQDIAANFIAGVLLSVRRPFVDGDIVETNGFFGTVEQVNLRSTWIRTFQGQTVIVPNKEVFQNPVTNYSKTVRRRVDLRCGVAYGDDLERAAEIALDAVDKAGVHDADQPVDLYYEEFGDSSINFVVRFWIDFSKQTDYLRARSHAIVALKKAFDDEGITIPFPIRTLDFGVVGGEKLNEVLPARLYEGQNGDKRSLSPSS